MVANVMTESYAGKPIYKYDRVVDYEENHGVFTYVVYYRNAILHNS